MTNSYGPPTVVPRTTPQTISHWTEELPHKRCPRVKQRHIA